MSNMMRDDLKKIENQLNKLKRKRANRLLGFSLSLIGALIGCYLIPDASTSIQQEILVSTAILLVTGAFLFCV